MIHANNLLPDMESALRVGRNLAIMINYPTRTQFEQLLSIDTKSRTINLDWIDVRNIVYQETIEKTFELIFPKLGLFVGETIRISDSFFSVTTLFGDVSVVSAPIDLIREYFSTEILDTITLQKVFPSISLDEKAIISAAYPSIVLR